MKTAINLDMNRIFDETEVAVRERAAQILQEAREERENPQLAQQRTEERDVAAKQEAQDLVDSLPSRIAACIARGEQSLTLFTVSHGYFHGYNVSPARVVEEAGVRRDTAVAKHLIALLTGIDKLHVRREDYQQSGRPGGFFVRVNW